MTAVPHIAYKHALLLAEFMGNARALHLLQLIVKHLRIPWGHARDVSRGRPCSVARLPSHEACSFLRRSQPPCLERVRLEQLEKTQGGHSVFVARANVAREIHSQKANFDKLGWSAIRLNGRQHKRPKTGQNIFLCPLPLCGPSSKANQTTVTCQ